MKKTQRNGTISHIRTSPLDANTIMAPTKEEEPPAKAGEAAAAALEPETKEEKELKRKERLEQNRVSARESRKRKKTMIEGK